MITINGVLANLTGLVGTEFDSDEIICAFEDLEEDGETEAIVNNLDGKNTYAAYINAANSTQFIIEVGDENLIQEAYEL